MLLYLLAALLYLRSHAFAHAALTARNIQILGFTDSTPTRRALTSQDIHGSYSRFMELSGNGNLCPQTITHMTDGTLKANNRIYIPFDQIRHNNKTCEGRGQLVMAPKDTVSAKELDTLFNLPNNSTAFEDIIRETILSIRGLFLGVERKERKCGKTMLPPGALILLTSDSDPFREKFKIHATGYPKILFIHDAFKSCGFAGSWTAPSPAPSKTPAPTKIPAATKIPTPLKPVPTVPDKKPKSSNKPTEPTKTPSPTETVNKKDKAVPPTVSKPAAPSSSAKAVTTPQALTPGKVPNKTQPSQEPKPSDKKPSQKPKPSATQPPSQKPKPSKKQQPSTKPPVTTKPKPSTPVRPSNEPQSSTKPSVTKKPKPSTPVQPSNNLQPSKQSQVSEQQQPSKQPQGSSVPKGLKPPIPQLSKEATTAPPSTTASSTDTAQPNTETLPPTTTQGSINPTAPPSKTASSTATAQPNIGTLTPTTTQGSIKPSVSGTPSSSATTVGQNVLPVPSVFPFPAFPIPTIGAPSPGSSVIPGTTTATGGNKPSSGQTSTPVQGGGSSIQSNASTVTQSSATASFSPSVSPSTGGSVFSVSSPSPSPTPDSGSTCFPASAIVELESGEKVRINTLKVGSTIKVGKDLYSKVFDFSHADSEVTASFLQITTGTGKQITVTQTHFMYTERGVIPAGDITMHDYMRLENGEVSPVVKISKVQAKGLYNPQTYHGDIIVDGYRASTYTVAILPYTAHALLAPIRWIDSLGFRPLIVLRLSEFVERHPYLSKVFLTSEGWYFSLPMKPF